MPPAPARCSTSNRPANSSPTCIATEPPRPRRPECQPDPARWAPLQDEDGLRSLQAEFIAARAAGSVAPPTIGPAGHAVEKVDRLVGGAPLAPGVGRPRGAGGAPALDLEIE